MFRKKIGILSPVEYVLAHPQIFTTASKIWPKTKYPEPFQSNGSLAKYIGPRRGSKTGLIKITEYTRRGRTTNKRPQGWAKGEEKIVTGRNLARYVRSSSGRRDDDVSSSSTPTRLDYSLSKRTILRAITKSRTKLLTQL